jgi:competence protein ComEA
MEEGMRWAAAWRAVMVAGAVLGLLGAGFALWRVGTTPSPAETVAADAMAARRGSQAFAGATHGTRVVLVYVSGAVAAPGLYRLASGLRVGDAIAVAGGLLQDADPDRLPNLAGRLTDGKQIRVARLKAGARLNAGSTRASPKVDINSADLAELEAVPGIDPALAQAIIDYRENYGPFASVNELKTALGLDAATLSSIHKYLSAL